VAAVSGAYDRPENDRHHPNLMLNIAYVQPRTWVLVVTAFFGMIIQSATIVVSDVRPQRKEAEDPERWAEVVTIVGNALLSLPGDVQLRLSHLPEHDRANQRGLGERFLVRRGRCRNNLCCVLYKYYLKTH